ncbi:plexin-A2-like isoform X2 [Saccostrea cucullata]|uniref:plexin-A2-like isoform X2 n=1 Tax=Saccostrea cuccullata TaxID=36930 RepID=UPI002ED27362
MAALAAGLVVTSVLLTVVVGGQKNKQFDIIFENHLNNFPLQNIEYDPWSNNFFASGKNILYRLGLDGKTVVSKQIRPKEDCFPKEEKYREKYCKDDYNYVMVVTPDSLITCSTLYGGRCIRRNKMTWNDTSASKVIQVMSEPDASAVGIFLNVSVMISESKTFENLLLFAKNYVKLPISSPTLEKSVIFSALPNLTARSFSASLDKVGIFDIFLGKDHLTLVKMDFRVAIENEDFVFLLVNQNSQAKLVKICKSIDGRDPKKVYEDIPISCSGKDGTNYTSVVHGTFVSVTGKRYLVALFTNSSGSSATCVYSEEDIYQAFLKSRRNRYGCPKNDLPENDLIFDGALNIATCRNISNKDELSGIYEAFHETVFCNHVTNGAPQFGIIIGQLPLEGTAVYTTSHLFTVVGRLVINDLATLYIGTTNGLIIKVFLDTSKNSSIELEELKLDNSEIKAVKDVNSEIYAMSQNKIVKLHQQRNCSQYSQNCTACMGAKDAHCGWCINTNSCSLKTECTNASFWLPSVKKQCLDLRFNGNLLKMAIDLDSNSKSNFSVKFVPKIEVLSGMSCMLGGQLLRRYVGTEDIKCEINLSPSRRDNGESVSFPEGEVLLKIILNNVPIAARHVLFYKCASFSSCGKCLENDVTSCYWCQETANCSRARGDCKSMPGSHKISDCPQINSQTVKIPSGRTRDLKFVGNNLSDNFTYQCLVDGREYVGEFINSGKEIYSVLQCKTVQISGKGEKIVKFKYGPSSATVDLESFTESPIVSVYKCESLSPNKQDCSTCHFLNQSEGYECQWCQKTGCVDIDNTKCSSPETCSKPVVTKVDPSDGPLKGGTKIEINGYNFGIRSSVNISVAGEPCNQVKRKGRRLTCTTRESTAGTKSGKVIITIDGQSSVQDVMFTYKKPEITGITPNRTIKSGGRTIILTGTDLNIGNRNYKVEMISSGPNEKKESKCIIIVSKSVDGKIACKPSKAEKLGLYTLKVTFDINTKIDVRNMKFEYLKDPNITGFDPTDLKSINSGGTPFFVIGKGFEDVIENVYVGRQDVDSTDERSACRILNPKRLKCKFPAIGEANNRRKKRATSAAIVIHLDGFTHPIPNVVYVDDPFFMAFYNNATYTFDPSEQEAIRIVGRDLATVAKKEDYLVLVGSGECAVTSLNATELICRPPAKEPSPRLAEDKLYLRVHVGNARQIVGIIEYANEFQITIIIIVVLVVILVAFSIGAVLGVRRVRTRNQLKIAQIMTEMQDLEQNTMRMHQEEFAEMQLNITDIKRDLVSTGIPYHTFQNYAQYILFPKEVESGSLIGLLQHSGYTSTSVQKAMDQFEKLMSNKYFVKSLIGTLEKQRKITLIDKAQFSANFSVVMMGKMRDFFEIVNCLLSTLVDASNKKQHKTLFNRFESITLRLLSHWLSISIYPFLKEGGGSSLFMLYKSTQAVVEKRPVDEVTGEAKNTLSESNFLREKIDCHALKLEIDLNANGNLYTCEVLDCDTINQVKSKCLYQIYKNKPASEMPTIDEVDLEWLAGKSGRLTLSNIDQTSEREDGMVRLNTLQHYNVMDGSRMALLYKFSPDDEEDPYENQRSPSDVDIAIPPNVHLIQSVSTTGSLENLRRWHLVKNLEEEESPEKHLKPKDMVKTSHITNLMHTKLVLQDNIKEVFDSVLNHETVPLVVHYLFGVLENLANKNGVEPETLLCWKSESYAMRVWATLLVRPEFLFDIQKVKHVEPCLDVIKQVFIDCFHSTKISKDSSLQKLLFAQEVPHYQKRTEQFYKALANKAAVTDADFWNEMSRLNTLQQEHLKFSKPAALQKLYKFVQQYMEEIIEDLDEGPETSGLQFGKKLDEIIRQMETDS